MGGIQLLTIPKRQPNGHSFYRSVKQSQLLGGASQKERTYISAMLSNKNSKHNETKASEERGIYNELQKELIRALRNNATNPWTEMIEFPHTPIRITVMVRSICLELTTCGAICWSSVILTNINILQPKFLPARLVEWKCDSASVSCNIGGLDSSSSHLFIASSRSSPVSMIWF